MAFSRHKPTTTAVAPGQRDGRILAIAWTATLAVSHAPQVLLADALGLDAVAVPWLWVATAALLVVVASAWRPARPLRGYFTVMCGRRPTPSRVTPAAR